MTKTCKHLQDCNDELVGCIIGSYDSFKDCPYKTQTTESDKGSKTEEGEEPEKYVFPWTGNVFGETDLKIITTHRTPTIIGLVGSSNAGKTSALTALFLLLRKGLSIKGYSFSGSYTLNGWENLASFLTFTSGNKIEWPPHTSRNAGRVPGLLHLSFINKNQQTEDILFTDAPGEWFSDWAVDEKTTSKGAKWINDFADAFILFSDCEAFNKSIGDARRELKAISGRMSKYNKNRPLALVWSKSDIEVSKELKLAINGRIEKEFPKNKIFDISVKPNGDEKQLENILSVIEWLLMSKQNSFGKLSAIEVKNYDDFFFVMR